MTELRLLIAGNWKMSAPSVDRSTFEQMLAGADVEGLGDALDLLICPPTTLVAGFADAAQGRKIAVGAQDCHHAAAGAHTGEVSAELLAAAGARFVILGHSERRADNGETDAGVAAKVAAAARGGLAPILCVGEQLAERDDGRAIDVVRAQLQGALPETPPPGLAIAYEPVWAIGTGRSAALDDIGEMHHAIQADLIARYGADGAKTRVLYGGSVKPANAADILALEPVGGALIGGASLEAQSYIAIARLGLQSML